MMNRDLTVTVIIPVYRPGEKFGELMRRLAAQTVRPERILIMNTEEQYFNPGAVRGIPNVSVYHLKKSEFDHGGTRNRGAGMADTDLLLFMTMDAVPADTHLIEEIRRPFADERVGAAYARQLPNRDCSLLERYTRQFNYGDESRIKTAADLDTLGIKTFFCSNVCAAYRRSTYQKLGGFEHRTIFNEDMIFAGKLIQAGFAVAYCSGARVLHSHNYSGIEQFHRNFDLGVSQADHPEIFGMARSESEGMHMVKQTAGWLVRSGHILWLPKLIWQSGCKFLGYRLGKSYRKLPSGLIRRCTMNPEYWAKEQEQQIPRC